MSRQYLRRASLIVAGSNGEGLDLSDLRIVFAVRQWDLHTPNNALIRVYNVSDQTAQKAAGEFSRVILQVGYQDGALGGIFDGTIVQIRRGREDAANTYMDILAADGDKAYNFAIANFSLAAGSTPEQRFRAAMQAMEPHGAQPGYMPADLPATTLPRGRVMFGPASDFLSQLSDTTATTWSIQNGMIDVVPVSSYKPGEALVLTSNTGLIGLPEQTQQGIEAVCLINPELKVNGRVQINNRSIQQSLLDLQYDSKSNFQLPNIKDDGFYRIVVIEHEGDTRGNEWYSKLTCVGLDQTVTPGLAAKGYG